MTEPREPERSDTVLTALLIVAACSMVGLFAQAALAPMADLGPWGPLEALGLLVGVTWAGVLVYAKR